MANDTEVEVPEETGPADEPELIENEDGSVDVPPPVSDVAPSEGFLENLAETTKTAELYDIADDLIERITMDKEARKKRDKQYEDGLRRTGLGDDAPGGAAFEGASRVVHPMLAEACVDFSARAIKELFPPSGAVRTNIEGKLSQTTIDRAEQKASGMNWQLSTGIPEYRDELEQLLTQTPMGGSQYMKFWVEDGDIHTEFVPIDNVYLPFAATNFYKSPRFTHAQDITRHVFEDRIRSGIYRDTGIDLNNGPAPEETASQKANDKIEGRDDEDAYNDDGLRRIFEVYTWRKLEGDGVSEGKMAPYIISIDEFTEEVLAIYRNWDENDPRMRKLDWFVEYKFIPWRGAYGIGLPHLIGGISAALTGTLRALLDTAHINNSATMLKLKGGRVTGQNTSVEVTQVTEIEAPAGIDDVRKIAMPMPFNPPSPVLFQLLGFLESAGKSVIATSTEALSSVGDRTPVGTTMALIEQGSSTYASIHSRLHASQRKALEIISRLNRTFPEVLEQVNDAVEFETPLTAEDFKKNSDIQPISDPNIFSEAQRYAQYQAVTQMSQVQEPGVNWNKSELYRIGMKLLKFPFGDQVLPIPPKATLTSAIEENVKMTKGDPVKAYMQQDHKAHLISHLLFATSPIYGSNPLLGNPTVPNIVQHCKEHLVMFYEQHATASHTAIQASNTAAGADNENNVHQAVALADQQIAEELKSIMPMLQAAMKTAMEFAPKPPPDPASAAALQLGQAEIQRKTALDQATMQLKQQELQVKQTLEQQHQAFEQQKAASEHAIEQQAAQAKLQQAQIDSQLAQMKIAMEDQRTQAMAQWEVQKNENDNHQKQVTEILKNRDDNETAKYIEMMKQGMAQAMDERAQQGSTNVTGSSEVTTAQQLMNRIRGLMP